MGSLIRSAWLSGVVVATVAACGSEVTFAPGADDDDDTTSTGTATGTPPGTPSGTSPGTPSGTSPGTPSGTSPGTPTGTPPGTPTGTPPGTPTGTPPGTPTGTPPGTPTGTDPCFPLTDCGGQCVDTLWSPLHCGGCWHPCDPDENCVLGSCECPEEVCGTCDIANLGSMVPQVVTGSTAGLANDFEPSCAAGGSPDMAYLFTAPASGQYVADTVGSSFDTVLHVFQHPSCAPGPCDDDGAGNVQSRVTGWMNAGDRILLVVDGFGGDGGSYVLRISQAPPPPPCPDQDLGSSYPQTVNGTTTGASHFQGSCGGDAAPEASYAFTAPVTGTYHVFTVGSSYDTLIYARAGTCNGPELGCDDDGANNLMSWIPLNLAAGQTVVIFVDGWGSSQGPYTLNILGP